MPENAKVYQFEKSLEKMETAALVDLAGPLKDEIQAKTEKLRRINLILAGRAEYKNGSKTGHAFGRYFRAKVQVKENESWDQQALEAARQNMGDKEFFKIFDWSFKPKSSKTMAGALQFSPHANLIEATRTVKPGAPQVSYESMEEGKYGL